MGSERTPVEHKRPPEERPGDRTGPGGDPEELRRRDEERYREEDERRRADERRKEEDRRRARGLRNKDHERRQGQRPAAAGDRKPPEPDGPADPDLRLPVGFVDPLTLLLDQAGDPPGDLDHSQRKIADAVTQAADRLDVAWRRVTDFAFGPGGVSPETAKHLQAEFDEKLDDQVRSWQKLCASNPFDLVGIANGANGIGRTIRRYRDRLDRTKLVGKDLSGYALDYGLRALASEVAAQLAVAVEPVSLLTDELSRLGRRDESLPLHLSGSRSPGA